MRLIDPGAPVLVTLLLALGGPADVQQEVTPVFEVVWSAPDGCPTEQHIDARIAGMVRNADATGPVRAAIEVVAAEHGGYAMQLRLETKHGVDERHLEAFDCAVLGDTAALIVAVAIDPDARLEREVTAPVELPEPAASHGDVEAEIAPPGPPITDASTRASAALVEDRVSSTPSRVSPRFGIRLSAGGATGTLPGFAPSLGVGFAVLWKHARIDLGGDHWFARRDSFASRDDVGARFTMWSGNARGCYVPAWRRFALPLCGGAELGAMRGAGSGVSDPAVTWRTWASVLAGVEADWVPHRAVALFARVDGVLAIARPRFAIDDVGQLHRPAPGGVRVAAGIEARFP